MDISRFRIDLVNLKYDESRPLEFYYRLITWPQRYATLVVKLCLNFIYSAVSCGCTELCRPNRRIHNIWLPFLIDCKTVRIFAYSSTLEQSNKRKRGWKHRTRLGRDAKNTGFVLPLPLIFDPPRYKLHFTIYTTFQREATLKIALELLDYSKITVQDSEPRQ